jgi:hypothetical protein|tara:strand:- start:536 stop:739 length:204 start_codon:yes stop_codon:yes gene_type:complete
MNDYRRVTISWNGEPYKEQDAIVCIGEWDGIEPDENILFYFENEEEFEFRKTHHDLEDFTIVRELTK